MPGRVSAPFVGQHAVEHEYLLAARMLVVREAGSGRIAAEAHKFLAMPMQRKEGDAFNLVRLPFGGMGVDDDPLVVVILELA